MKMTSKSHLVMALMNQKLYPFYITAGMDIESAKHNAVEFVTRNLVSYNRDRLMHTFQVGDPQVVERFSVKRSKEGVHVHLEEADGKLVHCRNSRSRWPKDNFKARGVHSIRTAKLFAKRQIGLLFIDVHMVPIVPARSITINETVTQNA